MKKEKPTAVSYFRTLVRATSGLGYRMSSGLDANAGIGREWVYRKYR